MKTWWNLYPILFLGSLPPFLIGVLPTVPIEGKLYGGGPMRQAAINWLASWLPADKAALYVENFMTANWFDEFILFLPIAINASLLMAWLWFGLGQTAISVNNWFTNSSYQASRKAAKH